MGPLPFLTLNALLVTGSVRGNYEVRARAELRARSILPGDTSTAGATSDLELTPGAVVGLDGGDVQGYLSYTPRLLVREPQLSARTALLHRAQFLIEKGAERRYHTYLSQYGAYGDTEFSLLSAPGSAGSAGRGPGGTTEPPPAGGAGTNAPQTVPAVQAIRYVESNTTVGHDARLTERFTLMTSLSWQVSGGATEEARRVVPFQTGPAGRMVGEYRLAPRDLLRTIGEGAHATFLSGQRVTIATLSEEYERRMGRHTRGELAAGIGASRMQRTANGPADHSLYPTASASLAHEVTRGLQELEGTLTVVVAPTIDRFNARVLQRGELSAGLAYTSGGGFWARARSSLGRSFGEIGQGQSATAVVAEASLGHALFAGFSADAGARGVWQRFVGSGGPGAPGAPGDFYWLSFVALNFLDDDQF